MFRFTIRDVLWLMALVAMGGGWWADHREQARQIRNLESAFHEVWEELHPPLPGGASFRNRN